MLTYAECELNLVDRGVALQLCARFVQHLQHTVSTVTRQRLRQLFVQRLQQAVYSSAARSGIIRIADAVGANSNVPAATSC